MYTPAVGFSGTDTFTYTVSDGRGASATATVVVQVRSENDPSLNRVSITVTPQVGVEIVFAGIPGYTYTVEKSENANGPWTFLTNILVPDDGIAEVYDAEVGTTGFYRTTTTQ